MWNAPPGHVPSTGGGPRGAGAPCRTLCSWAAGRLPLRVRGAQVARSSLIQKYLGDKIKGVNNKSDLGPRGVVGVRDDFLGPGCVGAGMQVRGSWVSATDPGPCG